MKLLLFAGTTEGRLLAERLAALPVVADVCVATGYGGDLLAGVQERFRVRVGRMDAAAMRELMERERYALAIDATHPYAVEASANIRAACAACGLECLRLARAGSADDGGEYVGSAAEAAARLAAMDGNVFLTTGSKDLAAYTAIPDYAARVFPRVLPTVDAIRECERLGFRRSNIVAMQGPFSRELNRALLIQFAIAALVSKDGGVEGGFPEKAQAAADVGARLLVVGRPPESGGVDLEAVAAAVRKRLEAEA